MDTDSVREAKRQAQEFVRRADTLLKACDTKGRAPIYGTRESGALRRQSMELTRALAAMRKPS